MTPRVETWPKADFLSATPLEILVLDDDSLALESIRLALGATYRLRLFTDRSEAERSLDADPPPLALLDLNLGLNRGAEDRSGLDVLVRWKRKHPALDVIFVSGETHADRAMECLRRGASDYLTKPFDPDTLRWVVARAEHRVSLQRKAESLDALLRPLPSSFVGNAAPIRALRARIAKLRGQRHLNVLILGESGTGKEVVARMLHEQEGEPSRPFVVVNMPALPPSLVEAELFGVEKGAYTDAKTARAGRFEAADGGDIFLDEIADISAETQAKLLRTLQERVVERVGSSRGRKVSFRVIAATNQPVERLIGDGRFREDLFYRLGDIVLRLPALRERTEDIPALVEHFIDKYAPLGLDRRERPYFTGPLLEAIQRYRWPGNVRELESAVKRALVFRDGPCIDALDGITLDMPSPAPAAPPPVADAAAAHNALERELIGRALARHGGDRRAAMRELGYSRATFYRRLKSLRPPGDGAVTS